jgi:hypothetical protein
MTCYEVTALSTHSFTAMLLVIHRTHLLFPLPPCHWTGLKPTYYFNMPAEPLVNCTNWTLTDSWLVHLLLCHNHKFMMLCAAQNSWKLLRIRYRCVTLWEISACFSVAAHNLPLPYICQLLYYYWNHSYRSLPGTASSASVIMRVYVSWCSDCGLWVKNQFYCLW